MAKSSVRMKLLIDTQDKRVLFAEASKECVDFLFYVLSLPVATVVGILREQGMVGSLSNLYQSIENLNESYIQPNQCKDNLLKPKIAVQGSTSVPLLQLEDAPTGKQFYRCSIHTCGIYITDDPRTVCRGCKNVMSTRLLYLAPAAAQTTTSSSDVGGFVKGVVTYMILDNLDVKPLSTISSITLLNKFNVKEVGKLEEKVVNLGMNEAVKLLKASLQSQKVLTDVFLRG